MTSVLPSLWHWWVGHAVAVAATHSLRVWAGRGLAWSETRGRAGGRQCFVEQHGLAVFYGGSLALHLASSLPVVLFAVLLCNVWDVTRLVCSPLSAAAAGLLGGLCRAPADHALLAAQVSDCCCRLVSIGNFFPL